MGSIVNIAVHQNHVEEKRPAADFWELQDSILSEFGKATPASPVLQVCIVVSLLESALNRHPDLHNP